MQSTNVMGLDVQRNINLFLHDKWNNIPLPQNCTSKIERSSIGIGFIAILKLRSLLF